MTVIGECNVEMFVSTLKTAKNEERKLKNQSLNVRTT